MKRRIFFAILLIAAAWLAGQFVKGSEREAAEGPGRDELHETFELGPGARVEVRAINGPVRVETSDAATAEVHVVRTSATASALEHQRVFVEKTTSGFVVRGEGGGRGLWRRLFGRGGQVRQEVTLKVPRRTSLEASGINGRLEVGELQGHARVSGVNGRVEIAQPAADAEIHGVNGQVFLALARVGERGVSLGGVNGEVEFRLKGGVNADVEITGQNGGVTLNVPNLTSQERPHRSRLNARLGSGGPVIRITGLNGHARFQTIAPTD